MAPVAGALARSSRPLVGAGCWGARPLLPPARWRRLLAALAFFALDSLARSASSQLTHPSFSLARTQIRALKEELDRPLNVHRWRHLESSDPSRFEMIRKIQSLQKRLIKKTEEVMEKENFIAEKEKLYVELKNILGRQPGPEVGEQIVLYQTNLKEKHKQMKAMNEELEMYKQQVQEFRDELTAISNDGRELKNTWIKRARKQSVEQ
jgi:hypothetical protein